MHPDHLAPKHLPPSCGTHNLPLSLNIIPLFFLSSLIERLQDGAPLAFAGCNRVEFHAVLASPGRCLVWKIVGLSIKQFRLVSAVLKKLVPSQFTLDRILPCDTCCNKNASVRAELALLSPIPQTPWLELPSPQSLAPCQPLRRLL